MRTYGRITQPDGTKKWVVVQTEPNGDNSRVRLTTLLQVLKGQPNESPFYSQYGIAAQAAVMQQVIPDFYSARAQAQFAQYFAALTIAKLSASPPTYRVNAVTFAGVTLQADVQVPQ